MIFNIVNIYLIVLNISNSNGRVYIFFYVYERRCSQIILFEASDNNIGISKAISMN